MMDTCGQRETLDLKTGCVSLCTPLHTCLGHPVESEKTMSKYSPESDVSSIRKKQFLPAGIKREDVYVHVVIPMDYRLDFIHCGLARQIRKSVQTELRDIFTASRSDAKCVLKVYIKYISDGSFIGTFIGLEEGKLGYAMLSLAWKLSSNSPKRRHKKRKKNRKSKKQRQQQQEQQTHNTTTSKCGSSLATTTYISFGVGASKCSSYTPSASSYHDEYHYHDEDDATIPTVSTLDCDFEELEQEEDQTENDVSSTCGRRPMLYNGGVVTFKQQLDENEYQNPFSRHGMNDLCHSVTPKCTTEIINQIGIDATQPLTPY